jgi:hypothetical protein
MQWRPLYAMSLALLALLPAAAQESAGTAPAAPSERLYFNAEWRFVKAGEVELSWSGSSEASLKLKTVGFVGRLYRVDNTYTARYDPGHCILNSLLDAREGRRHKETRVTFDRTALKAFYHEQEVGKDAPAAVKEIEIPACVHDVVGALEQLRLKRPEPGKSATFPVSDGKKVVSARVEALGKELVRTPLGQFPSTKYEAFLFSGVLYRRNGRLFVWISDDDRRLPVQIKVQLPFYVGNVTIQLERVERD